MATTRGRRAVARALQAEMDRLNLGVYEFARVAGVNPKTLRSMLDATRWPRPLTQQRVARAVGWGSDWIELLGNGIRLDELRAAGSDAEVPALRNPSVVTLDVATEAELTLALARLREMA